MATIYDISRETGYSIATVSKVINNYKGVSQAARQTIEAKIAELGFTPNSTARTLATKKSWLVAILFAEEKGMGIVHPHYSSILQGFKDAIGQHGYDILFLNPSLGSRRMSFTEHCRFRNVDGVMLAMSTKFTAQAQDLLADAALPKVSVESIYPGVPTVISDNAMGARQAMEHLYMMGHRRIAHIAAPQDTPAGQERYQAYRQFLADNDLPFDPALCVTAAQYNKAAGADAVHTLLQQCWDHFPTAIYAAYDDYACAAEEILTERGFRVPEDVSIVGNDDLPAARFTRPGITTVRQDRSAIGAKAAELLVQLMEQQRTADNSITRIPTELVVRQSTFRNAK